MVSGGSVSGEGGVRDVSGENGDSGECVESGVHDVSGESGEW